MRGPVSHALSPQERYAVQRYLLLWRSVPRTPNFCNGTLRTHRNPDALPRPHSALHARAPHDIA